MHNTYILWIQKLFRILIAEIFGVLPFVVTRWPNTPLGCFFRRVYWKRKTGVKNILVGRCTGISDMDFIEFGDNIAIGDNSNVVVDGVNGLKIKFGSNISIARGFYLRSSNHDYSCLEAPIWKPCHISKRVRKDGKEYAVVIEDNVWIGANVVVVSGAFIGKGSAIGAGSIVTSRIPENSVAAGNPARVIKTL